MTLENLNLLRTLLVMGALFISSSEIASAQIADQLPNQQVPLSVSAKEAILKQNISVVEFSGPASFVSPASRTLILAASKLSQMSEKAYQSVQTKWLGSTEAACNFFVITALCEAGYCKVTKPFYRAAQFGEYFRKTGWVEVSLTEAKKFLENVSDLDLVAQRGPIGNSSMGHIGIPIGLDSYENLIIAQGNYHQSTHEREVWSDEFASPFHYFVNFSEVTNDAVF